MISVEFNPAKSISVKEFGDYLLEKAKEFGRYYRRSHDRSQAGC